MFWTFVGAAIQTTVIEWSTGHILEWIGHSKWWDYSNIKWNLDGYVSLPTSVLWGILGTAGVLWGNHWIIKIYHTIPITAGTIILWICSIGILSDIVATLVVLSGKSRNVRKWNNVDNWFIRIAAQLESSIYNGINKRMDASLLIEMKEPSVERIDCFAYGCSFYKIVLLFVIGSFLGDLTETIFCWIRGGIWMRRSSLVWGPFSIVWGFAFAAVTILLYRYRNNSDRFLFITGTVLGGTYEYLCSMLSELVFGMVFWDYSKIPYNLSGRINLLYCIFWGLATVIWFKMLYPWISDKIEQIPKKSGTIITWCFILFMCVNMTVSALALIRSNERSHGTEATASWQKVMDERFDDSRLEKLYPNMIRVN